MKQRRKSAIRISLMIALILTIVQTTAFAQTDAENATIDTVEGVKLEIREGMEDGILSSSEKATITENATEEALGDFIVEKMDAAINLLNENDEVQLSIGQEHATYTYDLGDGCKLTVELSDQAESLNGINTISPMATSGSSTLWKAYGGRYFTAKASVDCQIGTAYMNLENHYTLSANGIDERYGTAYCSGTNAKIVVTKSTPSVDDAIARTVGASNVDISCVFTLKVSSDDSVKYKLNTTVGYVDIDKANEQIKVKQSWSLTKTS